VAHEAIFRRWDKLSDWVANEREFLAWRTGFEAAQRTWRATPDSWKKYAMLMGLPLAQAKQWSASRGEDLTSPDRAFVADSIKNWGRTTLPGERLTVVESVKQWGAIILPREKIPSESAKRPNPVPQGSKVFISYRRLDTGQIAGRIYDRLVREMPQDEIFFDIDTIPPGVDFKQQISKAVSSTAVLLVLVGEKWVMPSWKRSSWRFGSKLKEDFVRLEIESALDLGVPIIAFAGR
jgi:hypothetical protein